ncbi:Putative heavy-metal chelation [Austwickia chelonae]|uniref:Putative heavy-metal chelation domain-containing protein n=1 Tax=Austwickia chelonae NBRC 105200 TaxID=1184607 RepID=K6W4S1_9MICO|nr:DUF364 domain-containing protein [Austwickia chelonae]GAB76812.1 hypothetical protein AUCHE_03_00290 [Austwickia chelonae NBRC 105200]SEW31031.1 Putative heavy-metal chelation [Austwickia chelonae]
MTDLRPHTITGIDDLVAHTLQPGNRPHPGDLTARSVFYLQHGTRLAGSPVTYRNQYLLVRVEQSFGACAFETGQFTPEICDLSGSTVEELLNHPAPALRLAALDAYLACVRPHREDPRATVIELPTGTPDQRAIARDAAISSLLDDPAAPVPTGSKVALIGVVNPLVQAIREHGCEPLPCDYNLEQTHWGDPVSSSMEDVLTQADHVIATGMTMGNGSFDTIRDICSERRIGLTVYAQSGSAVAREFLGAGVTNLSAEHFPFSQFSADASPLYLYRATPSS